MTGMYVRVQRGGQWQPVEVEDLTDEEWAAFVAAQEPERGWRYARRLALWIRERVQAEPD